jgi:hypothetical protein
MMGVKMDSVKSSAKQIINMLLPCNTEFAIMGFTGDKDNPVPYRLNFTTNKTDLNGFIDKLNPWGGTRIGAAIKVASLQFKGYSKLGKNKRATIILLSDGLSDDNIAAALKEIKDQNAFVQTDCIGYDLLKEPIAEQQLRQIAFVTGGEYYQAFEASNVIKAFVKSGIKTIIHEVPVAVRKRNKDFNFKPLCNENYYKLLTTQNWFLDSIQINAPDSIYAATLFITNENMQDTLPKSLVFDNAKKVSLYIDNGSGSEINKKWVEGNFNFNKDALTITFLDYYFKLIVKAIDKKTMVLCVNKFQNVVDRSMGSDEEICDCSNKIKKDAPYILVYFSKAGCN